MIKPLLKITSIMTDLIQWDQETVAVRSKRVVHVLTMECVFSVVITDARYRFRHGSSSYPNIIDAGEEENIEIIVSVIERLSWDFFGQIHPEAATKVFNLNLLLMIRHDADHTWSLYVPL